jgi:hypothetical protein
MIARAEVARPGWRISRACLRSGPAPCPTNIPSGGSRHRAHRRTSHKQRTRPDGSPAGTTAGRARHRWEFLARWRSRNRHPRRGGHRRGPHAAGGARPQPPKRGSASGARDRRRGTRWRRPGRADEPVALPRDTGIAYRAFGVVTDRQLRAHSRSQLPPVHRTSGPSDNSDERAAKEYSVARQQPAIHGKILRQNLQLVEFGGNRNGLLQRGHVRANVRSQVRRTAAARVRDERC